MKKLSESIWSDMQDRSAGDMIRKEDEKTNINDIVPLDMGVDVLWADRDLEWRDGGFFFTYNEVKNITDKSEWRIPTKNEVNQLLKHTKEIKNTDEVYMIEGSGAWNTLTFNIKDDKGNIIETKSVRCNGAPQLKEAIRNNYRWVYSEINESDFRVLQDKDVELEDDFIDNNMEEDIDEQPTE